MKTFLLLELEPTVDPVSAARAFSEAHRVMNVMSIVDDVPMEIWRQGEHIASETSHPMVRRAQELMEHVQETRNDD